MRRVCVLLLTHGRAGLGHHRPLWGNGRFSGVSLGVSPLRPGHPRLAASLLFAAVSGRMSGQRLRDIGSFGRVFWCCPGVRANLFFCVPGRLFDGHLWQGWTGGSAKGATPCPPLRQCGGLFLICRLSQNFFHCDSSGDSPNWRTVLRVK